MDTYPPFNLSEFLPYVLTIVIAILPTHWFAYLIRRKLEKKDNKTKLLLGLCHDRLFYLGMSYIKRGWITRDELENLTKYLATPYFNEGGNGVIKPVVERCLKLPVKRAQDLTPEDLVVFQTQQGGPIT